VLQTRGLLHVRVYPAVNKRFANTLKDSCFSKY
jgi:hypothetical protein